MKRTYRLLEIYFRDASRLKHVYTWQHRNEAMCARYSLRLVFIRSDSDKIVLYGYDGKEKWSSPRLQDCRLVFDVIRSMPMAAMDVVKNDFGSNSSLSLCGLPIQSRTSHCFRDETHRTCCMLGRNARSYADRSGNPIGEASVRAFYDRYGFYPSRDTLTPWCTCLGSKVCSYYAKRFDDGTHIRFIDDRGKIIVGGDEDRHRLFSHRTPGVPSS